MFTTCHLGWLHGASLAKVRRVKSCHSFPTAHCVLKYGGTQKSTEVYGKCYLTNVPITFVLSILSLEANTDCPRGTGAASTVGRTERAIFGGSPVHFWVGVYGQRAFHPAEQKKDWAMNGDLIGPWKMLLEGYIQGGNKGDVVGYDKTNNVQPFAFLAVP